MDKRSARCLGLEGGQSRRDAKEATKNAANFLTQCHQPTIIDDSATFFKICLFVLAISMAQSIIRDRLLFFAVHFEGFTENYPFLFEGLQNILKGM
jgi:hypothetical protein